MLFFEPGGRLGEPSAHEQAEVRDEQADGDGPEQQRRVSVPGLRVHARRCALIVASNPGGGTLLPGATAASTIRAAAPRTNEAPASSRNSWFRLAVETVRIRLSKRFRSSRCETPSCPRSCSRLVRSASGGQAPSP